MASGKGVSMLCCCTHSALNRALNTITSPPDALFSMHHAVTPPVDMSECCSEVLHAFFMAIASVTCLQKRRRCFTDVLKGEIFGIIFNSHRKRGCASRRARFNNGWWNCIHFSVLGNMLVCACSPGCVRPSKSLSFGSEIRGNERCCVRGYMRARVHESGRVRRHESEIPNWNVWCQRTASAVCLPTASPLSPSQHTASSKKKKRVVHARWCLHVPARLCVRAFV